MYDSNLLIENRLRPLVIPHHKGRKRMHLELRDTVTKLMTTDFKQKIINSVSATLSTVYNIATGNQQPEDGGAEDDPAVQRALEDSMSKQAAENDAADAANPRSLAAALNSGGRVDFVLQEAPFESFNEYLFAMASHLCYWESEDTALMILKDIYEQLSIYPDDHQQLQPAQKFGQALPPPPPTNYAPTPTIAPPPIAMGAPMSGPSVLQPSATPTIAPPPIPVGAPMAGPPTLQPSATPTIAPPPIPMGAPMSGTSVLQPSSTPVNVTEEVKNTSELQTTPTLAPTTALGPPSSAYNSSTPLAPAKDTAAPQMFSPAGNGPSPIDVPPPMGPPSGLASAASPLGPPPVMKPLAASGSPYPKAPAFAAAPPAAMGMDPTAPPSSGRPLGPPPMGGFYKKS